MLGSLTFKAVLLAEPHNFMFHIINSIQFNFNFINVRDFYDSDQISNLYSVAYACFTA